MINDLLSLNLPEKKKKKKMRGNFTPFIRFFFYIVRSLLSIIFPLGFIISKDIGHPTLGSGVKYMFKRYLKSEHTDKHTDGQKEHQVEGKTLHF